MSRNDKFILDLGNGQVIGVAPGFVLDDISDVTIVNPLNGQVLQYNGTIWVNVTGGSGG